MTQVVNLVRNITEDLRDIEQTLRPHAYAQAFRDGSAPVEALVPFVGHQYHILNADTRSGAEFLQRIDADLKGDVVRGLLQGAHNSRERLSAMAEKLDLSEADLQAYEPSADGFAFAAYFSLLVRQGTPAEVMCALLVNLPVWGFNCREIGQGLREHYGWSQQDTAFLDAFAAMPAFEREALPIIRAGLDCGENPKNIARAAHLMQHYEQMFWDAVAVEASSSLEDQDLARRLCA